MNEQTRERLRMHSPEFYDVTENRVAIAQEHSLIELFRDARREGSSIGTFLGSVSLFLSTMFSLESTQTFQDRFGVPASSWQAIFIIVAVVSFVVAIWSLSIIFIRWRRKKLFSEDVVKSRFFSEEKRMGSKPTKGS
jgi:MFS family permease